MISANELRQKFLDFFKSKGHAIVPSASLLPENDPSSLFTTAGMQPMVPYLMGEKHPLGTRIADVQKCIRTGDIDDVGDNRHLTFFEMLGNWSLGDYFKEEAIKWSWEFLTDKKWLGLDPNRLYITVFKGELGIPKDEEAIKIWQQVLADSNVSNGLAVNGLIKDDVRIIPLGADDNFWIAGTSGPCGGDTEMFYDTRPDEGPINANFSDLVDNYRLMEIWNDVFMEFFKSPDGQVKPLTQKNVDTGMGIERTITVLNGLKNVFETELFIPLIKKVEELSGKKYSDNEKAFRIVCDHLRAATMILGDEKGITPSNVGAGYVLRRLIRRAVRYGKMIGINEIFTFKISEVVIEMYKDVYPEIKKNKEFIINQLTIEEEKFSITIENGIKEIEKLFNNYKGERKDFILTSDHLFNLYQSQGFPIEMSLEEIDRRRLTPVPSNVKENFITQFKNNLEKHQELSRTASAGMFKGGLADSGEMPTKYHTATHLLLASMRELLSPEIYQKGSNITAERLRFDFNYPQKLTSEQIKAVEDLVNQKISEKIPVELKEMPKAEALKLAKVSFDPAKYGDIVKVYKIGDFSIELCGGPHVTNTGDLGHFKITKEEASSAGVRRIKAVLE